MATDYFSKIPYDLIGKICLYLRYNEVYLKFSTLSKYWSILLAKSIDGIRIIYSCKLGFKASRFKKYKLRGEVELADHDNEIEYLKIISKLLNNDSDFRYINSITFIYLSIDLTQYYHKFINCHTMVFLSTKYKSIENILRKLPANLTELNIINDCNYPDRETATPSYNPLHPIILPSRLKNLHISIPFYNCSGPCSIFDVLVTPSTLEKFSFNCDYTNYMNHNFNNINSILRFIPVMNAQKLELQNFVGITFEDNLQLPNSIKVYKLTDCDSGLLDKVIFPTQLAVLNLVDVYFDANALQNSNFFNLTTLILVSCEIDIFKNDDSIILDEYFPSLKIIVISGKCTYFTDTIKINSKINELRLPSTVEKLMICTCNIKFLYFNPIKLTRLNLEQSSIQFYFDYKGNDIYMQKQYLNGLYYTNRSELTYSYAFSSDFE